MTGSWDRWACSDRDPGHQKQRGNTSHECRLHTWWVWDINSDLISLSGSRNLFTELFCWLYFTAYKKSLEDSIRSDTSGHFCRILVSLVQVTIIIIMRTQTVFNFHAHSLVESLSSQLRLALKDLPIHLKLVPSECLDILFRIEDNNFCGLPLTFCRSKVWHPKIYIWPYLQWSGCKRRRACRCGKSLRRCSGDAVYFSSLPFIITRKLI